MVPVKREQERQRLQQLTKSYLARLAKTDEQETLKTAQLEKKAAMELEGVLLELAREIMKNVSKSVFPKEGITNEVLNNFLSATCSESYMGVFDVGNLPYEIAKEENYHMVINTWRHFVVLLATPKELVYIDPLGNGPPRGFGNRNLTAFLKKAETRRRQLHIRGGPIQSAQSAFCGLYCMLFVILFDHCFETPILNFTPKASLENDKLCVSYLLKVIDNL